MSAMTDALRDMQQRYPDLSLTPLRMSDHLLATQPRTVIGALSAKKARAIRDAYAAGDTLQRDIAARFGVTQQAISRVIVGRSYREVA